MCDPDELCSGGVGGTCPADTITPAGTTCRFGVGDIICDPDEVCSGAADAACPGEYVEPSGFACGSAFVDACTLADTCDGGGICLDNDLDTDSDGDGVWDCVDICPGGNDNDDDDGDGNPDFCDICPGGDDAIDPDADGVPSFCDNCPGDWNPTQTDTDGDGEGDACETCSVAVDGDFDGFNQCVDCNDYDGSIYPGQTEVCNGVDDDCDGLIDEDFDVDLDTYSICSTDPMLFDCDDSPGAGHIHPGAPELCFPAGVDEDCDGYIDEGCGACNAVDTDGDLVSECDGDCQPDNGNIYPGADEVCDGLDTDCNLYTIDNCDVSETCDWDGDGDPTTGNDVCGDDLLCACVVQGQSCNGTYICTSSCEGSFTGNLGAGCTESQTCLYRLTSSNNQHACAETPDTFGAQLSGTACGDDSDCRSNDCAKVCPGGPPCNQKMCSDWCDHDEENGEGSCATGTVCYIHRGVSGSTSYMYARCLWDDAGYTGTVDTGGDCSASASSCIWGPNSCVNDICAEPCGLESHCPSGYHCSLEGIDYGNETVPVCLADTGAGAHDRQAGSACSRNSDCESEYCENTRSICMNLCTDDESCPTGLLCENAYARLPGGSVTFVRMCQAELDPLNTTASPYEPMP
jgi:hypothetical protein